DYNRIIELTEMNQNVAERATIYAKVADLNYQAGKTDEAESYLAKAMELDPGNPDFLVLQGDWKARAGDYDAAFAYYDKAVAMGLSGVGMYEIRAEARLKQMQDKYGTTSAQELRSQMTPTETQLVCTEVKKALELGLMNPQMDMFSALVCK
ncbi:MAG: tetratricopeptide repeat protein, partial [Acidobacteriota bacterium]